MRYRDFRPLLADGINREPAECLLDPWPRKAQGAVTKSDDGNFAAPHQLIYATDALQIEALPELFLIEKRFSQVSLETHMCWIIRVTP